jgi:hypothetical protein
MAKPEIITQESRAHHGMLLSQYPEGEKGEHNDAQLCKERIGQARKRLQINTLAASRRGRRPGFFI